MGSRITIYHVKKNDYKRNISSMGEEKLEEILGRSKIALKLDRKGLSLKLAKFLGLRAGNGQKVSISKGSKIQKDILENISSFDSLTISNLPILSPQCTNHFRVVLSAVRSSISQSPPINMRTRLYPGGGTVTYNLGRSFVMFPSSSSPKW